MQRRLLTRHNALERPQVNSFLNGCSNKMVAPERLTFRTLRSEVGAMDMLTTAYYAIICAVLGMAAPVFGNAAGRLLFGAAVGVAAALMLPHVKAMIG